MLMSQKKLTNSFLVFLAVLAWPSALYASELININTASLAELETLPGVGPSIAQSIIDNRSYASIQEVSRASGIGEPGSSSYEKIKDLITVGSASAAQTATATSSTSTQTQAQQIAGGAPPLITVRIHADSVVTAGGGSFFEARVYGAENLPIDGARFMWNFGDGTTAEGQRVFHTYSYPGRYSVLVTAAYNYSSAMSRTAVGAIAAALSLIAEGDGSLVIRNLSKNDLDIGRWSLNDSGKQFVIPEDTLVLGGEGVRFATVITGLSGSPSATLLYPNGMLASAAQVSANSPLRGERVVKDTAVAQKPAAVQEPEGEVLGTSTSEPVSADAKTSSSLWLSLGALAVLLAGGGGAVHYLGLSTKRPETPTPADGFDIVD